VLTEEQVKQYITENVFESSEEIQVAFDHKRNVLVRIVRIKLPFALRMVKCRFGGHRPVFLKPLRECTIEQRRAADDKPIWSLRVARELLEDGSLSIAEPAAPAPDVPAALQLHFGRSARAVGGGR
jgi:hypothetical protein